MASPVLIAKAAIAVVSDERLRKGVGWALVAIFSPIIVVIALLCSLGVGAVDQNISIVELCFNGGTIPDSIPEEYRVYIEDIFLTCGPEHGHVPLDVLNKLTESGSETYAALLDAEVSDIRGTGMEIELTLDGVTQEELIQFYEDYKSHQWAEDHMTMYM